MKAIILRRSDITGFPLSTLIRELIEAAWSVSGRRPSEA
jgi:hypothetical protein